MMPCQKRMTNAGSMIETWRNVMFDDLWWNNKCRRYAEKLRETHSGRASTSRGQTLRVYDELMKASKTLVDGHAHDYLLELDRRLDDGEFTPNATKKIRKAMRYGEAL